MIRRRPAQLPSQRLNDGCSPLANESLVHLSTGRSRSQGRVTHYLRIGPAASHETGEARATGRLTDRVVAKVEAPSDAVAAVGQGRVHSELRHEERIALLQWYRHRLTYLEFGLRYLQPRL